MCLVTNFIICFSLCLLIEVIPTKASSQSGLIMSLMKAHRILPLRIIIGCDSEKWFYVQEFNDVCENQNQEIVQPVSIIYHGNIQGRRECVRDNFTQAISLIRGAKYSHSNHGQNLLYFGDVRHGLRIPRLYGKLFNLHYTDSLLLIRSVSVSFPHFNGGEYSGELFSHLPSLTFVLNKKGVHRMCFFCLQTPSVLIHSFIFVSTANQINDVARKFPFVIIPSHWVAFFNFELMGEKVYSPEFFEDNPIKFGYNYSEMNLGADIVKYLNVTELLNCPLSQKICQRLQPEYSVESSAGVIGVNYHGTLILTPHSVELNFMILIPEVSNVFYSLLRIPFKWKFVLATVASTFAICLATFCFQMKDATVMNSLVLTVSFMIRSTISQSIAQFSSYSRSLKLIWLTWLFCCIVLTELYKGQSIGNFVIPEQVKPINSFKELIDSRTNYKLVAKMNERPRSDFDRMRKDIMGNQNFGLCRLINSCAVCGLIRAEFDATKKTELKTILDSMKDFNLFIFHFENILPRLAKPNHAVLLDASSLRAIKMFLLSRNSGRKYHISTNGFGFPKYTAVRQDLFAEKVIRLIRIFEAGGVQDIHVKIDRRLHGYKTSAKIIEMLNSAENNKSADYDSNDIGKQSYNSRMTLKNFRNLFLAAGFTTKFILVVFMCEVCTCFIEVQIKQLKKCLSRVFTFVRKTFEFLYHVGFRNLIKLRVDLKRLPLNKYFLLFLNKGKLAKDSCSRRSTRVNCQNSRSESDLVNLDSRCLKNCTSLHKTHTLNTAKTNIGDINRSKLRKLFSRANKTFQ